MNSAAVCDDGVLELLYRADALPGFDLTAPPSPRGKSWMVHSAEPPAPYGRASRALPASRWNVRP
jgi:hypothetical protein